VNETLVEENRPKLAGFVGVLDRWFPALWVVLYLLLPVSGWASEMFDSWLDQERDLEALRSLIAHGHADAIASDGIGPAYIGLAALVHDVLRLSPEDSLVAVTRTSYALSIALGLVLVRVLVTRWATSPPMISLAAQLVFLAFVFAAGTWYWSDVPWSHFLAMFLAVAVYASRFARTRPSSAAAATTGVALALLAATRSFEFMAVVLAWGIGALGFALLRRSLMLSATRHLLFGAAAFVGTTVAVYAATGKRDLFFLYGGSLDTQSGSLSGPEVAHTPTLTLGLVPVKLVQLFVDPCYLSLCSISDYSTGGGNGTNKDFWSLPLAVQLPALVLLPLCIAAVAYLALRAIRRRLSDAQLCAVRPMAEMTVAATGIVVGYAASTLTGPSHLRYGFARDFLLPALLSGIVAVALGSIAAWHLLARRRRPGRGPSPEVAFVAMSVLLAFLIVGATAYGRTSGLPRIESRHIEKLTYTATCTGQECGIHVEAAGADGGAISIPAPATLTFGCGSFVPKLTLYVERPADGVSVAHTCTEPVLVAAWPTVMGLPPGSYELAAVRVKNA
jgi:hypothetical protein